LKFQQGEAVSEGKVQEFLKKHPPWFMLDIHPIHHAKRISEQEEKIKKEMREALDSGEQEE